MHVFDGTGREFLCRIGLIGKTAANLEVLSETEAPAPESPLTLTLAATLTKGEKFDLVVQKSVELGVTRLIPMITARCDIKLKDSGGRLARWQKIVFWLDTALKSAEEFGITKANADQMKSSKDPFVLRLLGMEGDFGKMLGLDNEWSYRAIKASGNYGEMYETHFGPKALDLPRGLNNLYTKGGMHYTLPLR